MASAPQYIQFPYGDERPARYINQYPHWATEATLEKLVKMAEKKWGLTERETQRMNKAVQELESGGKITKEGAEKLFKEIEGFDLSKLQQASDTTTGSMDGLMGSISNLDRKHKEHTSTVGKMGKMYNNYISPGLDWMRDSLAGASTAINRMAGEFSGLYFTVSRMVGPMAGLAAAIYCAGLGLTLKRLNEEAEMYERGMLLMRRRNDEFIGGVSDFVDEFTSGKDRLNIGFDELVEVFGEFSYGLRHHPLEDVAKSAKAAHTELAQLGYKGKDSAQMLSRHLDQMQRLGIAQRMDYELLSNQIVNMGRSTNYFAQMMGKSREEVAQGTEEFMSSIDAQYMLAQRYADPEHARQAYENLNMISDITGTFAPALSSGLREMVTAGQKEWTDSLIGLRAMGPQTDELIGVIEHLRENLHEEDLVDPEYLSRHFGSAISKITDESGLAEMLERFGSVPGSEMLRELVVLGSRFRDMESHTLEELQDVSGAGVETAKTLDDIHGILNNIKGIIASEEFFETRILGGLTGTRDMLDKMMDPDESKFKAIMGYAWEMAKVFPEAAILAVGAVLFKAVAGGWMLAKLGTIITSVLGALGLGGLIPGVKKRFPGGGTTGTAGTRTTGTTGTTGTAGARRSPLVDMHGRPMQSVSDSARAATPRSGVGLVNMLRGANLLSLLLSPIEAGRAMDEESEGRMAHMRRELELEREIPRLMEQQARLPGSSNISDKLAEARRELEENRAQQKRWEEEWVAERAADAASLVDKHKLRDDEDTMKKIHDLTSDEKELMVAQLDWLKKISRALENKGFYN